MLARRAVQLGLRVRDLHRRLCLHRVRAAACGRRVAVVELPHALAAAAGHRLVAVAVEAPQPAGAVAVLVAVALTALERLPLAVLARRAVQGRLL